MKNLSTKELNEILMGNSVTRKTFLGTFPACMVPVTKRKRYAFITNSQEHNKPGEHWNAWFVNEKTITFFDSFSRKPTDLSFPHHYQEIIKKFDNIKYVDVRVQSDTSQRCGLFCIHWIYVMSLGLKYDSFLSDYTENLEKNDYDVLRIVNSF